MYKIILYVYILPRGSLCQRYIYKPSRKPKGRNSWSCWGSIYSEGIEQVTIGEIAKHLAWRAPPFTSIFPIKEEIAQEIFQNHYQRVERSKWTRGVGLSGDWLWAAGENSNHLFNYLFKNPREAGFVAELNYLYAKEWSAEMFAETMLQIYAKIVSLFWTAFNWASRTGRCARTWSLNWCWRSFSISFQAWSAVWVRWVRRWRRSLGWARRWSSHRFIELSWMGSKPLIQFWSIRYPFWWLEVIEAEKMVDTKNSNKEWSLKPERYAKLSVRPPHWTMWIYALSRWNYRADRREWFGKSTISSIAAGMQPASSVKCIF